MLWNAHAGLHSGAVSKRRQLQELWQHPAIAAGGWSVQHSHPVEDSLDQINPVGQIRAVICRPVTGDLPHAWPSAGQGAPLFRQTAGRPANSNQLGIQPSFIRSLAWEQTKHLLMLPALHRWHTAQTLKRPLQASTRT